MKTQCKIIQKIEGQKYLCSRMTLIPVYGQLAKLIFTKNVQKWLHSIDIIPTYMIHIYNYISSIDISKIITFNSSNIAPKTFIHLQNTYFRSVTKTRYYSEKDYKKLFNKIHNNNNVLFNITKLGSKKCDMTLKNPQNNKDNIFVCEISKLYLETGITRLQNHFLLEIPKLVNSQDDLQAMQKPHDKFIKQLTNIFSCICDSVPLILYHFSNNCITIDTSIIFSLYFSYCGDWDDFIKTNCPGLMYNIDEEPTIWDCAIQTSMDKLKVNFNSIISYYKDTNDPKNMTTNTYNDIDECVGFIIDYITEKYNYVQDYYKDTEIFLWTTFDWMIGKNFLKTMYTNGKNELTNYRHETQITSIKEKYSYIFPWIIFLKDILEHKELVLSKLAFNWITYVYKDIHIKMNFIMHAKNKIDDNIINSLYDTKDLYVTEITSYYENYLFLYGISIDKEKEIKNLINKIQLMDLSFFTEYGTETTKKRLALLLDTWDKAMWFKANYNYYTEINYLDELIKMLQLNCNNLEKYIHILYADVHKSILSKSENPKTVDLNCTLLPKKLKKLLSKQINLVIVDE